MGEQLRGEKARSQFGGALKDLGMEWIAAQSPQANGRIERLFETLQDRLVKEMRLAGIATMEEGNHFFERRFLPEWEPRFTKMPRPSAQCPSTSGRRTTPGRNPERAGRGPGGRRSHRQLEGHRWGVPREEVCAGLRGARVEIERRLDGSHGLRFRGRYLRLRPCPEPAPRGKSPFKNLQKCPFEPSMADISIWQKPEHFYFALTRLV
jgi:hypothetical protein